MNNAVTLIGIHGQIGQGKSEFFHALRELYPDLAVAQLKFAQPVYDGLYAMNPLILFEDGSLERLQCIVARVGWEAAKEVPEVRRLLQVYGTEAGRDIHGPDCWVKLFHNRLQQTIRSYVKPQVIINDDLRFIEEFKPHHLYGGITVKLFGPNRRPHTANAAKHSSENRLPDHLFDYLLWNTGTIEEYRESIKIILKSGKPKATTTLGRPE